MISWPQNAYVGQKVVRFRNSIHPAEDLTIFPAPPIGEVVTISWIDYNQIYNLILIDLNEYPSPEITGYFRGLDIRMFCPVQSTETGMKILKGLLVPTKEKADA